MVICNLPPGYLLARDSLRLRPSPLAASDAKRGWNIAPLGMERIAESLIKRGDFDRARFILKLTLSRSFILCRTQINIYEINICINSFLYHAVDIRSTLISRSRKVKCWFTTAQPNTMLFFWRIDRWGKTFLDVQIWQYIAIKRSCASSSARGVIMLFYRAFEDENFSYLPFPWYITGPAYCKL